MKKIHKFGIAFAITGIIIGSTILIANTGKFTLQGKAEKTYQIVLNNKTNAIPNLVSVPKNVENSIYDAGIATYTLFDVTTNDGNKGLKFFAEGAFINPNGGYAALGYDGGIGNYYQKDDPYKGRISGLKEITVNYTGYPLNIAYSFEEQMAMGVYAKTSVHIQSGVAYSFDNTYPSYFAINSELKGYSYIDSVTIKYSCNMDETTAPKTYLDSGYHYGAADQSGPTLQTAKSHLEVSQILEQAVVNHKQYVLIDYAFKETETVQQTISSRRNFSHVEILTANRDPNFPTQQLFLILYVGDTLFNNDLIFNDPSIKETDAGFVNHNVVAGYHTNQTDKNTATPFVNARTEVRNKYNKNHGLLRPANFNSFAVDKLPDSKNMKVYNSEELWWALEKGYKPVFPLENSKAEWIYNEARQILREICYDTMTPYEKIRAIYEWIIDNTQYDYDALDSGRAIFENVCFFLEGVFERRLGVCDSFSKTFVLLGKIEGLDVLRGVGYGQNGGHAWGYFRADPSQSYYLICPTWGDTLNKDGSGNLISYINYDAFMAPRTYFEDATNNEFSFLDLITQDKPMANMPYTSNFVLDCLPEQPQYNYEIDSYVELVQVINTALDACDGKEFVLPLAFKDESLLSEITRAQHESSLKDIYAVLKSEYTIYNIKCMTLLFDLG